MSERHLLDAAALLCLLDDASGADRIAAVLDTASITSISVALVAAELTRRGAEPQEVGSLLRDLHLTVLPFGFDQAIEAGTFNAKAGDGGEELEHRAWLAAATKLGARAVSGTRDDGGSRILAAQSEAN